MKFIRSAIAVLFVLITGIAQAQCRWKVTGTVTDEISHAPLEFVTVYLKELSRGCITDSIGKYEIGELCSGQYTFRLSHIGCEPKDTVVEVKSDLQLHFRLPHSANMLESVQIISDKVPEQMALAPELNGAALDQTRGATLAGSLLALPGVNSLKTGGTIEKPVIHGLFGNRVLVYNNGVRLESQDWGSEHAPEVDPFIASKITVVKGAGSVRYGSDAIGGVILAEAAPFRDSAGTGGQVDLAGFTNGRGGVVSGMLEHRFSKFDALALRIQGTAKRSGNIEAPDYFLKNTGMEEYDFSWAASYDKKKYGVDLWYSLFKTKLAIFSGSHIGNLTDFEAALESDTPAETSGFSYEIGRPYQNVAHEIFRASAFFLTGDHGRVTASYSRQYNLREEFDKDPPLDDSLAALNLPELSYELTSHIGDITWDHQWSPHLNGQFGINGQWSGNTFEGRYFIPNYISRSAAAYLIEKWAGDNTGVEAGLRYEMRNQDVYINTGEEVQNDHYDFSGFSGSLAVTHRLNDALELMIQASSAWRAPSVNELYADGLHHGAAAVEKGDLNLTTEKALNISGSINYRLREKWMLEAVLYHSVFNGFIYLQPELPASVIIQGTFPTYYYRQSDARLSGADVRGTWQFAPRFSLQLKAAGMIAQQSGSSDYLPGFPPARFGAGLDYRFSDKGKLSGMEAGISAEYVTEQTHVPSTDDYVPPPPAYTLLSMHASTRILMGKVPVSFSVSVDNLLNTTYRDYLNRFRYYADDMGRNITFRAKIPFNF